MKFVVFFNTNEGTLDTEAPWPGAILEESDVARSRSSVSFVKPRFHDTRPRIFSAEAATRASVSFTTGCGR